MFKQWDILGRAGASTEYTSTSTGKSVLSTMFSIFIFIILGKTSTQVVLSLALTLGALAIVFCLALDLLKCHSLIEWNEHFDRTAHYFVQFWSVLDGRNWSKQVLSSFFHFVRKKQVLDGKNPTLVFVMTDFYLFFFHMSHNDKILIIKHVSDCRLKYF